LLFDQCDKISTMFMIKTRNTANRTATFFVAFLLIHCAQSFSYHKSLQISFKLKHTPLSQQKSCGQNVFVSKKVGFLGRGVPHAHDQRLLPRFAETDNTDNSDETVIESDLEKSSSEENNDPFSRINEFLDTPLLDANNRSDQGAIAETLKDFVRDDPFIAQVFFSAAAIAFFILVIRVFNAVRYGGF